MRHIHTALEGVDIGFFAQHMLWHDRNAGVEFQTQHLKLKARGGHLKRDNDRLRIRRLDLFDKLIKCRVVRQLLVLQLPFKRKHHIFGCQRLAIAPHGLLTNFYGQLGEVFVVFTALSQPRIIFAAKHRVIKQRLPHHAVAFLVGVAR